MKNDFYENPMNSEIMRFIVDECNKRDIKIKKMAADMKIHPNTLSNWLSGKAIPQIVCVEQMLVYLGYGVRFYPMDYTKKKQEKKK